MSSDNTSFNEELIALTDVAGMSEEFWSMTQRSGFPRREPTGASSHVTREIAFKSTPLILPSEHGHRLRIAVQESDLRRITTTTNFCFEKAPERDEHSIWKISREIIDQIAGSLEGKRNALWSRSDNEAPFPFGAFPSNLSRTWDRNLPYPGIGDRRRKRRWISFRRKIPGPPTPEDLHNATIKILPHVLRRRRWLKKARVKVAGQLVCQIHPDVHTVEEEDLPYHLLIQRDPDCPKNCVRIFDPSSWLRVYLGRREPHWLRNSGGCCWYPTYTDGKLSWAGAVFTIETLLCEDLRTLIELYWDQP